MPDHKKFLTTALIFRITFNDPPHTHTKNHNVDKRIELMIIRRPTSERCTDDQ
jgi:hypothetical protein